MLRPVSTRGARLVLLGWLLTLIAGLAAAGPVFHALTDIDARGSTEAGRASARLAAAATTGVRLVGVVPGPVGDPAVTAAVTAAAADLRALPGVAGVLDLPGTGAAPLAADDRRAQLVVVDLATRLDDAAVVRASDAVARRLHATGPGPVLVGGGPLVTRQANAGAVRDLARAELVALPIALLVLVVVFGGLLPALLPLLVALCTVSGALVALLGLVELTPLSSYSVNVVTMFGLGLAIDYALLVLSRFREERGGGLSVADAVRRCDGTSGRTVGFSALTVSAALAGLLLFRDPTLTALAVGGITATAAAVLAARTLLPALLLLLGHRLRPRAVEPDQGGFARTARVVARRPLVVAGAVTVGLALCAVPLLHLTLRHADYRVLPAGAEARRTAEALEAQFPGRVTAAVTVVLDGPTAGSAYAASLARLPGVVAATPRAPLPPGLGAVDLAVRGGAQGEQAQALVRAVRADRPPGVTVTGDAAYLLDHEARLGERLPWAALAIVLATLVVLFLLTGSVVVPVKAVLVAALSLSASLGVVVWGFQDGHLTGLLGSPRTDSIQLEVPLVVFVFAYGLSLDYEVFLLGRVKEAYDASGDPFGSVALGLQRTGRVITSAALLIVIVFAGFASGGILLLQEVGVGLAVAVLVDATVVRCLLVPAVMALLGHRNWWAPPPLARLHARVGLSEGVASAADGVPVRTGGERPGAESTAGARVR